MKVLGTILIAITGLVAQMNVAPAATRADVFRSATSQNKTATQTANFARGVVAKNSVKSRAANATRAAGVPVNVLSRTAAKPVRVVTERDATTSSGVKARATNVQSRTNAPKTTSSTHRSVGTRTTLGRTGQLQPSTFNKPTNVSGDNYVKMIVPSELQNLTRMSEYISLSGGSDYLLLKKTNGALPNLKTFFKNYVIKGAYSDSSYNTQVIDREGAVVSGQTVPATVYIKVGGEDEQLIHMLEDMNIVAGVYDINDDAAVVYDMEHDVCLFFKFETSGNDITNVYPVGLAGATNNEGSCDTTAEEVSQMTPINN